MNPDQPQSALGTHILLELYDCPPERLKTPPVAEAALLAAARAMGATVRSHHFHAFSPYGVSGVVIIEESHLTVHTWPEYGYAAVDIFTCGRLDTGAAVAVLRQHFDAQGSHCRTLARGLGLRAGSTSRSFSE